MKKLLKGNIIYMLCGGIWCFMIMNIYKIWKE
ncbi:hypothetical protein ACVW18_005786 [Bacillus thuringiensis]